MALFTPVLKKVMAREHIPKYSLYHDCVDTGASLSLTGSVEIPFPCDGGTLEDFNSRILFNTITSNVKDSIDNAVFFVKLKMTINGNMGSFIKVRYTIPHPTFGNILVDEQEFYNPKNNLDYPIYAFNMLYNGSMAEASTYGFNVTIEPTSTMTLKARSILVGII